MQHRDVFILRLTMQDENADESFSISLHQVKTGRDLVFKSLPELTLFLDSWREQECHGDLGDVDDHTEE